MLLYPLLVGWHFTDCSVLLEYVSEVQNEQIDKDVQTKNEQTRLELFRSITQNNACQLRQHILSIFRILVVRRRVYVCQKVLETVRWRNE